DGGVDARPDNMVVLAAVVVDVKDDSAGLAGKPQLFFGALDKIEILRAGEDALLGIGIDRQAVEIFAALCRRCAGAPLLEGAAQVPRDGATQFENLDA